MTSPPAAAPRLDALADPATGDGAGLVGVDLSTAWTATVDDWVRSIGDAASLPADVALVAVGGYGRGELSPGSDLDLLLLHGDGADARAVSEAAEKVWYPIWDAGLKLGHSVRTIDEALDLAADDLDTATSLLDIRSLIGAERLVATLADRARRQWRSKARRHVPDLVERTRDRHRTAGEVAFLLEPDLKLSQGGLRDVHTLRWLDLADDDYVEPAEREGLTAPHDVLLAARVELHRRTGRPDDRLLLQEQDEVAAALGYEDADELMAAVAGAARAVVWTEDAVLHRTNVRRRRLPRLRRGRAVDHGHGITVTDGTLRLAHDAAVDTDPVLPLRVAVVAARHDSFIERADLDWLADRAPDLPDPWPADARAAFVDLLLEGHKAIRVLETLDQVELLTRILPEWAPNRSRPQRNAYHRFTVDRHLFEAAAGSAELADRVARPDLLVLGGLFHDIGKGYPGDHSVVGVELVQGIAARMGYADDDIDVLSTLVRHHLLLPDVASRRDVEDEGTIRSVAAEVGSAETITLLAALTEADSVATGPSAWNSWKAELVYELAERTILYLNEGHLDSMVSTFPTDDQLALAAAGELVVRLDGHELLIVAADRPSLFSRVCGALALQGVEIFEANLHTEGLTAIQALRVGGGDELEARAEAVVDAIGRAIDGRLAVRARLTERARDYRRRSVTTARPAVPRVVVDNDTSAEATVLEVRGPDSIGLLYRVTRAFVELDLDILTAKVQTLGHDVVDAFYLRDRDGEKITDSEYLAEIEVAVLSALAGDA